ncbi:MAG: hypothetical protein WCO09_04560 [bacterium]
MIRYDVLQRSSEAIEEHSSNWYYYFESLKDNFGIALFVLFVIGLMYSIFLSFKKDKFALLLTLWISFFLIIFTIAKTRLSQYIMPIYPAIAILLGYLVVYLQQRFKIKQNILVAIFCILILNSYLTVFNSTYNVEIDPKHQTAIFLKDILSNVNNLYLSLPDTPAQGVYFVWSSYIKGNVIFYKDLNDISLGSNDFALVSSREQFDKINIGGNKYKIVLEIKEGILFEKNTL